MTSTILLRVLLILGTPLGEGSGFLVSTTVLGLGDKLQEPHTPETLYLKP